MAGPSFNNSGSMSSRLAASSKHLECFIHGFFLMEIVFACSESWTVLPAVTIWKTMMWDLHRFTIHPCRILFSPHTWDLLHIMYGGMAEPTATSWKESCVLHSFLFGLHPQRGKSQAHLLLCTILQNSELFGHLFLKLPEARGPVLTWFVGAQNYKNLVSVGGCLQAVIIQSVCGADSIAIQMPLQQNSSGCLQPCWCPCFSCIP